MTDQRPILSAKALGVTQAELDAAIEIRGLLAANQFIHDPEQDGEHANGFNMNCALEEGSCGTVGCIGGWMWAAMHRDRKTVSLSAHNYVKSDKSHSLHPLFYPDSDEYDLPDYSIIPPAFALAALDNFLTTGDPDWPSACLVRDIEVHPGA
jgi:hypothetical protein